jgi:hypothetical protein
LFLSVISITGFVSFTHAQQPVPVIFKPLSPPITDVYSFQEAGLIAISNQHELQLWDANTKAYYGHFGVLPTTAYNCAIRLVEYIPAYNTVAVVWEEYTTVGNNLNDTIYTNQFAVFNLNTLLFTQPMEGNGMLAFIKYKYGKQLILPNFNSPEKISQYSYNKKYNSFYTCDRNGFVQVYKNAEFEKTIDTKIKQPKLFSADTSNTFLLMADGNTAAVKRVNIETETKGKIANLIPTNICFSNQYPVAKIFNAHFIEDYNTIVLVDSVNRVQIYNATNHTIETIPFITPANSGSLIDFKFNFKDSSAIGIAENNFYQCERSLFTSNLKTGITNTFNGGNSLRITSSYYGNSPNAIRLMISGVSEQEIDLSTLSEKTNNFLTNTVDKKLRFTGSSENGYVSVFNETNNQLKLKVYEFTDNKTHFLYQQKIRINDTEEFAAIETKKKWYITITKSNITQTTGINNFTIYDSTQNEIFKLPIKLGLQLMIHPPFFQNIFSKDGRFLLIKEYLSTVSKLDSCRLRVFNTANFKQLLDISYTETGNGNVLQRNTALITDSSNTLYFVETVRTNGNQLNFLKRYKLNTKQAEATGVFQLIVDPSKPNMSFYVKQFRISKGEEMVLWFGNTNYNTIGIGANEYLQAVRGMQLKNTNEMWGLNSTIFPEIQNVLLFNSHLALQMEDHVQFYKWMNNGFENFLTLVPVYNEKTVEASSLFVNFKKNNTDFIYYEKTGNDDCISFKFGNHSYKRNLFDLTFNRPDLILEQIPNQDTEFKELFHKAVLKRSERIINKLQDFKPDLLPIISIKSTGYIGSKFRITISIKSKLPISEIRTIINGTMVKKLVSLSMEFGETEYNLFETLSSGDNAIEVVAITKTGIEGLPLRIVHNHNKQQEKPNLYVLVTSVSKYDNPNANLPFAVKDGRDISKLFASQLNDTMFNYIKVDTLFDLAANNNAVQKWLKDKKQVSPNDYVIVFYSGHGLLNNQKELQLSTSKTSFDSSTNTIDFLSLLASIDVIPARQKLLLIDACHSGDLDKSNLVAADTNSSISKNDTAAARVVSLKYKQKKENAFEAMQKLFSFSEKGNGTVVFSASGGMQYAYEGASIQNGYFTYALIEALLYNKATEGQQGMLWLNQLIKYATKRVIEISGGKQTPNLRIAHPDINWRIK